MIRALAAGLLEYAATLIAPLLDKAKAKKRRREIEEALPVFLRQTASCLQASLTVRQAITEGALSIPGPLGEELAAAARELDSGLSLDNALDGLAERCEIRELFIAAAVFKAGSRYGGDIAAAARSLSAVVRKRQAARRETSVLTVQARYSALILSALPIAFFMFFPAGDGKGPLGALSTPAGWVIVLAGLALNAAGFFVMRRLTVTASL